MLHHHSHRVLLLLAISFGCASASIARATVRDTMSLDGTWSFATDPNGRGEAEKWYSPNAKLPAMPLPGYAPSANGTIRVPGIWDNQGYGTETDKVRHNFVGKGWYKRTIEIPKTWANRRTFLAITGVCRYSKVWLNDHFLGEHVGYLSTQEYDVTPLVEPGKTATVTIQIDSKQRWELDALYGCGTMADFMDVAWGGIWGHVFLESRSDVWLNDLYVQPDVPNAACSVTAKLNGKTSLADVATLEVFDKDGRLAAQTTTKLGEDSASGRVVTVKASLPNAARWTPDSPSLYTAKLSLCKGQMVLDAIESRFGMRQFTVDGPNLLLNGHRIMLRGYGDDHIYPEQMGMPCDKALHLKRLQLIKSYGFNHVRHHSTIMPPEYYDACDEVGIICTAEFPICYSEFLPGTGNTWKARVAPQTDPGPATENYKQQWTAAIKRHRNHPSILCWVMGNELWDGIPLRTDFGRIAKQEDPTRLFADSDGVWGCEMAGPGTDFLKLRKDRDTFGPLFCSLQCLHAPVRKPGQVQDG